MFGPIRISGLVLPTTSGMAHVEVLGAYALGAQTQLVQTGWMLRFSATRVRAARFPQSLLHTPDDFLMSFLHLR
jgi:hypothetical protein